MNVLLFMGNGSVVNSAGGAEKVLCNMANEMTLRGHHVTILCNDTKQGLPFYPLLPEVKFINLGGIGRNKKQYPQFKKIIREITKPLRKTFLYSFFPDPIEKLKFRELTSAIHETIDPIKPDVIVSYFLDDHYIVTNVMEDKQIPLILTIHGNPYVSILKESNYKIHSLKKGDYLQLLMPSYQKIINRIFPRLKTIVIPNVVNSVNDNQTADLSKGKHEYIITMIARLDKDKQQHLLLQSFSQIVKDYPHWKIKIYGGIYNKEYAIHLEKLICSLHLQNQVFLMGTTEQPLEILRESDIFAFPSAFEGFGLALAEAMSVGLPCVGLKTASAVNELIIDGYNGLLSENNEKDFAAKLKILMDNSQLRVTMGKNGHEFVKQFEPKKIWDQWENLFIETKQKHSTQKK
ncbi:MAG: glycosyltransferase [Planctomycetaceae bacterium]|jgi:glycosyltransferase involved in cell wall biosynthesis|nr:glycosyltransferase [Planctomycetaceae bacterium]